ncbi:hypothetical protein ZHAS_00003182 [Anopheles sinensis]|uniref:Uncharacterized protein n=1 Tax=Anopheles sinensis TaxID=74873 RepID=A0A084VDT9_ANOSI|nr:hypothetical protein ZHAS_00003182 [Anopheles sinensis]
MEKCIRFPRTNTDYGVSHGTVQQFLFRLVQAESGAFSSPLLIVRTQTGVKCVHETDRFPTALSCSSQARERDEVGDGEREREGNAGEMRASMSLCGKDKSAAKLVAQCVH